MIYKRILLKLSGESLMGGRAYGIDEVRLGEYAKQIKEISDQGIQIGIVIGGGNIFRGLAGAAKGFDRVKGDQMGMLATVINSLALSSALEAFGVEADVLTAVRMEPVGTYYSPSRAAELLRDGHVVLMAGGTGNPFFTTDTAAALEDRRPVLDAIDEVVTAKPLPEPDTATPEPTPGTISLDHVAFSYEDGTPVLRDITFAVPAKTMVALVGPSGCGKTTIARLISRFYDVTAGSVKVGGVDVREQTTKQLMASLSMVFQDVYLFDDTLEANIRIGREDATMAELHEAARLAGVTEIVNRLPRGWDTPVGEGGRALSGGERQRVAIARALLKQAPIVLLDEATSALDPENEENVVAAVDKLRETATILVIAHKLDTIRKADAIVQLRADGTVEDIGTHEELFARGGTYRSFWDHRAAAQGWQL